MPSEGGSFESSTILVDATYGPCGKKHVDHLNTLE